MQMLFLILSLLCVHAVMGVSMWMLSSIRRDLLSTYLESINYPMTWMNQTYGGVRLQLGIYKGCSIR